VIYPSMMYKMTGATHGNPVMAMFREFALQDRVPFQAMLAIASKHLAGVEGKADTVESLTHKTRALSLIKERIRMDAGGHYDGTIYATATMAVIEVRISPLRGANPTDFPRNGPKILPLSKCISKDSPL
jgi:hypothetical protein